jgi:hypothetical protein
MQKGTFYNTKGILIYIGVFIVHLIFVFQWLSYQKFSDTIMWSLFVLGPIVSTGVLLFFSFNLPTLKKSIISILIVLSSALICYGLKDFFSNIIRKWTKDSELTSLFIFITFTTISLLSGYIIQKKLLTQK